MMFVDDVKAHLEKKRKTLFRISYAEVMSACYAAHLFSQERLARLKKQNAQDLSDHKYFAEAQPEDFERLRADAYYENFLGRIPIDKNILDQFDGYARRKAFWMVKDIENKYTEKAFEVMNKAFDLGLSEKSPAFRKMTKDLMNEFGEGYTKTVFRNAANTSANSVRWQQMKESEGDIFGLMYRTVSDAAVRDEHAALHGIILEKDDPFWLSHWPPLGHNCRCQVVEISHWTAKKHGLQIADKKPDYVPPGTFGRPPENPYENNT